MDRVVGVGIENGVGVVVQGETDSDPQHMIYNRDKRINKLERKIRRRVVSHLSVRGSRAEVPSALIFMNAVKDAERIGDYIKNIYDVVRELMPETADRSLYKDKLCGYADIMRDTMLDTAETFTESDEVRARAIIDIAREQGQALESSIAEITRSTLKTSDAVSLVLIMRFYKRIFSHLSNIASTVCMPVDKMDFFDE